MINKESVKALYLNGYNAVQIARIIKSNKETVRKCIQRNFRDFEDKHLKAVRERKDCLRAINYESSRFMSDSVFIKKNRSIYKTLQNGDIVINREVAPIVTFDTPKRLINENSIERL